MVSTAWEEAKRHFLEYLAAGTAAFLPKPGEHPTWGTGPNAPGPFSGLQSAAEAGVKPPPMPGSPASGTMAYLLGLQQYHLTMASNKAAVDEYRSSLGLEGQLKAAEKALGKLPSIEDWSTNEDIEKRRAAEQNVQRLKDAIAAGKKATQEAKDWDRQAAEFTKRGDEAEMSALEKIYYLRDRLLEQGEKIHASESKVAAVRQAANEQAAAASKKIDEAFQKEAAKQMGASIEDRFKLGLIGPGAGQLKGWEEGFKADERIAGIEVDTQRQELRRQAARAGRMADLNPNISDEEAAVQAYQTRVELAVKLAQIEADRIAKEENAATKRVLAAQALKDLSLELAQAQEQFDEKQAELAQKRLQEVQKQIGDLSRTFEGLFHTLFTKPGDFGKQLGSTLREAALKPVTEGLGNMFAQTMHPLIYGSEGQGGLAGIVHGVFGGGKQDPVAVTTDNTTATVQNSRAIWLLTAVLSEAMGRGVPSLSTQGSSAIPNIGVASPSGFMGQMLRNTGGLPRFAEGGITTGPSIVGEAGQELVLPLQLLSRHGEMSLNDAAAMYGEKNPFRIAMMNTEEVKTQRQAEGERIMRDVFAKDAVGMQDVVSGTVASAAMLDPRINFLARLATLHANPSWNGALDMFSFEGAGGGPTLAGAPLAKVAVGREAYAALSDEEKVAAIVRLAKRVERIDYPGGASADQLGGYITPPGQRFTLPGQEGAMGDGLSRDVYNPALLPSSQRITTWGMPEHLRGQGQGQALYVAAMQHGPINWEEPFTSLKLTEESSRVRAALVQKGLAERRGDWMTLTEKAEELLGVKAPATPGGRMGDPTWFDQREGRDPWNQTPEQRQAIGRLGGIAAGKARRLAAENRDPELDASGNYIGPPVDVVHETMAEATARIDAVAPHLIGVDLRGEDLGRSASTKAALANPTKVLFGDELMTIREAAGRIGLKSPNSLSHWLKVRFPGQDWTTIDVQKALAERSWSPGTRLPSYDDGGTVARTGMAVVHQGEAVVPRADTLKHSIDANTKALQQLPQSILAFLRSMGSRMASPQAQQGSVVLVSGPGAGGGQQPMVGIPEVMTGSDQMSSTGWGAGVDPYGGQVYQPGPLPPSFSGSTVSSHFSLPGMGTPSQMLHAGATSIGTGLLSSGVRSGNPLTSAMGGASMGYGMAPMLGTSGTWGAVTGAGAGVAMAGLSRGGASGTAMSTGGGALIGLQMGGPIGAAIGAAAGLTAGLIREFGVETLADTAHKDIKELYGVDIPKNSGVIKQIVDMAKSQFGGSISMAVRSPSVRQLVMLYSESTGQHMPLSATTPRAGSLVEQGGGLYQAPTFQNGTPYVLPSAIPTLGNSPGTGTYPMGGGSPISLAVHVDGQGIAPFMTGQYMTPSFVADQAMAAQQSSYYRTQQSANLQQPGLYV